MHIPDRWVALLLVLMVGLVFFAHLPVTYDFDGTVFSQMLRYTLVRGELVSALQPHHFLYFPLNHALYRILQAATGYRVLEYFHLQLFSLMFGLGALFLVYLILARLVAVRVFAWLGTIAIAFSFGFWYYAVQAEVDMPALFFLLWGFYLLLEDRPGRARLVLAAVVLALAAGFHLTSVLISVSVGLVLLARRRPLRDAWVFFAVYGSIVAGFLLVHFLLTGVDPLTGLWRYLFAANRLTGHQPGYWSRLSPATLVASLETVASGIVYPAVRGSGFLSAAVLLLMAGVILWVAVRRRCGTFPRFALLWMFPHLLFFTLWVPGNVGFKLNVIVTLMILFVACLSRLSRPLVRGGVLLVCTLLIPAWQFFAVIQPADRAENNRPLQLARAVGRNTPAESVLVIAGCGSPASIYGKIYVPYFGHRRVLILDWLLGRMGGLAGVEERIRAEQQRGRVVYVLSELLVPGRASARLAADQGVSEREILDFFSTRVDAGTRIPLVDGYHLVRIARGPER